MNRVGAYVTGSRAAQKSMLRALLEPKELISKYELEDRHFEVLALEEECNMMLENAE